MTLNPISQEHSPAEYRQASTPELYAASDSIYTRRSHNDVSTEYRTHLNLQLRRISSILRARGLPSRSDEYRAGMHLWLDNLDFLTSLKVHIASDKPLKQWQFVESMKALELLPGGTDCIYAHWREYSDGHRVFVGLVAWDKLALNTPGSCYTKLGELEL